MTATARQTRPDVWPAGAPPGSALRVGAPFAPARFADRGVVLPATTPAFAFARVRDGTQGRELVLRNATGSRGAMLMPLAAAADYVRPTLHDRALFSDILRLPRLGPAQVGLIARAAARAGLAGRSALAAARAAAEAEARQAREALAALTADRGVAEAADAPRLAALAATARRLALLPPQLSMLAAMAADRAGRAAPPGAADAAFLAAAAGATVRLAEAALGPVLAALDDPPAALAALRADPSWPAAAVGRATWILDGWALLLARWEDSEGQGHAAEARALRAIAAALPPLPEEIAVTAEDRDAVRLTWRPDAPAAPGATDQAMLERLRVAAP